MIVPPPVVSCSEEEAAAEKALRLILDLVKISKAHSDVVSPEVTHHARALILCRVCFTFLCLNLPIPYGGEGIGRVVSGTVHCRQ